MNRILSSVLDFVAIPAAATARLVAVAPGDASSRDEGCEALRSAKR